MVDSDKHPESRPKERIKHGVNGDGQQRDPRNVRRNDQQHDLRIDLRYDSRNKPGNNRKSDQYDSQPSGYIREQYEAFVDSLKYKEIAEYVHLMNRPRKLIMNNLLSGIARGVGIALGLTVFLVTSLYLLRAVGKLNLPIVGDYIADIVKVVQSQLEGRTY